MSISANLSGKVAFVTGASSGLGRHFAKVLARSGAAVAIGARRMLALKELAAEIGEIGGRALPVPLDVISEASVRDAVAAAVGHFGALDLLVNNSGITVTRPALEQTQDDWDRVLNTNLRGAFLMATQIGRYMRDAQRPGSIINIASILGLRQASLVAPYAISKAGLIQLTRTLALELARYDIRVNAIAPGYIESDLNRDFFRSEAGMKLIKRSPQRRLGALADLDGALLLLASDASRYMTGSVLVVDGGHLTSTL